VTSSVVAYESAIRKSI